MKKIYFAPDMEIVKIQITQMLAASLPVDSSQTIDNENEFLAPELPGIPPFVFDFE